VDWKIPPRLLLTDEYTARQCPSRSSATCVALVPVMYYSSLTACFRSIVPNWFFSSLVKGYSLHENSSFDLDTNTRLAQTRSCSVLASQPAVWRIVSPFVPDPNLTSRSVIIRLGCRPHAIFTSRDTTDLHEVCPANNLVRRRSVLFIRDHTRSHWSRNWDILEYVS